MWSVYVCVHVYVYICEHVCVCRSAYTCACAHWRVCVCRSQVNECLPQLLSILVLESCTLTEWIWISSVGSRSGPHACMAITLVTEPSPLQSTFEWSFHKQWLLHSFFPLQGFLEFPFKWQIYARIIFYQRYCMYFFFFLSILLLYIFYF